ncbi:MAG: ATP phosphoribosyltransferase [Endomicrobiaceae bacterium]|nr:ATP phosphoribosyltransferase [Endomicrobiaceae bacterium]MDD3729748.1 ATP phosphoribosyltransferase [Endomicrobiaceae bacterium]MDD4165657.1 ATP phosphoribosyltransferase [Endomicrobiaceae bacterium]
MKKLKLGFPKGSLQESTIELFKKAGIRINASSRSYFPSCDDEEIEIMLVRSQEMAKYVQDGVFDAGLTGHDWICESGAKVKEVCELQYAKSGFRPVRWVLAVPNESKIKSIKDLNGKRVATELLNYTKKYFAKNKVKAQIEFSWGATEAKAGKLVDAIVELTETGSSLRANNLRIVEELLVSTTRLIANNEALKDSWKKEKIENLAILLKGALAAEGMVGLKMNIPFKQLPAIEKILPALRKPTISNLSDGNWVALEVIIEEKIVKKIIPALKRAGAEGIIEYPLNKIIY